MQEDSEFECLVAVQDELLVEDSGLLAELG
jgi:hypothetical protein